MLIKKTYAGPFMDFRGNGMDSHVFLVYVCRLSTRESWIKIMYVYVTKNDFSCKKNRFMFDAIDV